MALQSSGAASLGTYALVIGVVLLSCSWPFLLFGLLPRLARRTLPLVRGLAELLGGMAYRAVVVAPVELNLAHIRWLVRRMERRAVQRRADCSRSPRARRALRVLAKGARSFSHARDALWRVWLAGPDEQVWDLLNEGLRAQVFAAAIDPAQPQAVRIQIGAFCTARGLAPAEAGQRALFFVLTGQHEQHRAEDPDGALLAAAYRGARDEHRAAVRQALAGADDLDLVRVVAGAGRDGLAMVTPDEAAYLAGQLAGRRDWAGLWHLALDLPLADALSTVSRLGGGWQPADDRGQALLELLASAEARQITRTSASSSTARPRAAADRPAPEPANPAAARLIRRPLALMTPADLATVTELLRAQPGGPLELLAACLEYRFGGEIALGSAEMPVKGVRPDDVALDRSGHKEYK